MIWSAPACLITPDILSAFEIPTVQAAGWDQASLMQLATNVAEAHHLNVNHFLGTIFRESSWSIDVQSKYKNPDGTQERSFGLAQINLDSNPNVTIAQADDPNFALEFMASQWDAGRQSHWHGWRELEAEYGNAPWPTQ